MADTLAPDFWYHKGRILRDAPFYHLFLLQRILAEIRWKSFGVELRKGRKGMAEAKDYYRILGVALDATEEEIKSAYRKMAKKYHPDAHPGDRECERKFREINEAYGILGDPGKRKRYNTENNKDKVKASRPEVNYQNIYNRFNNMFGGRSNMGAMVQDGGSEQKDKNPLDTTEIFERFMGIKR